MRHLFSAAVAVAIVVMVGVGLWQKNGGEFGLGGEISLAKQAASIEKAATKAIEAEPAGEAEMRRIADAISGMVTTSFGGFDGTTATDVRITLAGFPDAGLTIEELNLYGPDVDSISSVMAGGEWSELRIADRIDASGMELFGLNEMAEMVMGRMMAFGPEGAMTIESLPENEVEAIEELEALTDEEFDLEMVEPEPAQPPMAVNEYAFGADRMVIDGLTLYPLTGSGADGDGAMAIVAKAADWYRSSSYERAVVWNMTGSFDVAMPEMSMDASMGIEFSGTEGWSRGDIENSVATGFVMEMNQSVSLPGGEEFVTNSQTIIDAQGYADIRLATLLGYLADGELPPTTETDLLSLGKWKVEGQTDKVGGEVISITGGMTMDMSSFHWLIPTRIAIDVSDMTYKVPAFVDYMMSTMSMGSGATMTDEEQAMLDQTLAIIDEQGLSEPTFDMDMNMSWDPESGMSGMDMDVLLEDGMREVVNIDLVLPDFAAFVAAPRTEDGLIDMEALGPVFETNTAFAGLVLSLEDMGLLEDIFAMVPKFAALVPADENPQAAQLAGQTGDQIRQMVSGLMRVGAGQAASTFPPAVDYVNSFADFILKGGTLTVSVVPATPMTTDDFTALSMDPEMTPEEMVDTLGLKVEHFALEDEI